MPVNPVHQRTLISALMISASTFSASIMAACTRPMRPATLMVSKYTAPNARYTNILMGTVQAAIANAVLDSVREGLIPKSKVNDIGIIVAVWLDGFVRLVTWP